MNMKIEMDWPWIVENERGELVAAWDFIQIAWGQHDRAIEWTKRFLVEEGASGKFYLRRKRTGKRLYATRYCITVPTGDEPITVVKTNRRTRGAA
jgi:hypothetical protein